MHLHARAGLHIMHLHVSVQAHLCACTNAISEGSTGWVYRGTGGTHAWGAQGGPTGAQEVDM